MKALLFLLFIPLVGFSQDSPTLTLLGEIKEQYTEPKQYYEIPVFGNRFVSSHDFEKSKYYTAPFYILKNESTISLGDDVKEKDYLKAVIIGRNDLLDFDIKITDKQKVYISGLKYPIKNDIITANGLVIAYKEEKGSWYLSGNIKVD